MEACDVEPIARRPVPNKHSGRHAATGHQRGSPVAMGNGLWRPWRQSVRPANRPVARHEWHSGCRAGRARPAVAGRKQTAAEARGCDCGLHPVLLRVQLKHSGKCVRRWHTCRSDIQARILESRGRVALRLHAVWRVPTLARGRGDERPAVPQMVRQGGRRRKGRGKRRRR